MGSLNAYARHHERLRTHEGAPAREITPDRQLRRSVLSCLLWEKEFYEGGQSIADRIGELCGKVSLPTIAGLAFETRQKGNLRHAPLLLCAHLAKLASERQARTSLVSETIARVVSRADELGEFLAVYALINRVDGKSVRQKLSAQVKKGLAQAFTKFDEYQIGKYNRDRRPVTLRDALLLSHPKPASDEQNDLWLRLLNTGAREPRANLGGIQVPDTWETALSAGADKRETFERLLREKKLGALALLRNLRNMTAAGVDLGLIHDALDTANWSKVLPFRFIAAARACPQLEGSIDRALCRRIAELPVLKGRTRVLVDVSGSMAVKLSAKSDLTRMDAAAGLASIINADDLRVFSFSHQVVEVPPRRGMAGVHAVIRSQSHGGTYLGSAVAAMAAIGYDRLIVITDEQSADAVHVHGRDGLRRNYMINVASSRNGVGYGPDWTHIDGFSENVIRYIYELENAE